MLSGTLSITEAIPTCDPPVVFQQMFPRVLEKQIERQMKSSQVLRGLGSVFYV